MSKTSRSIVTITLALAAAALLGLSLKLPMWKMRMEAPQYRGEEAIKVRVYPGALGGDVREIATLNQYIGVSIPKTLPQCEWLPTALVAAAAAGLAGAFLPRVFRKWMLFAVPTALSIALLFAAIQARQQMYEIGHHRKEKTPLRGVKDFTPPFLGKAKLFQFEVESWFGGGAYAIAGAIALQLGGFWMNRKKQACCCGCQSSTETSVTTKTKEALA